MAFSYSLDLGNYNKTFIPSTIYPELTGNLKIIIDSDDKLYLHSINANNDINASCFKKYNINLDSTWNSILYGYFRNSNLQVKDSIWSLNEDESIYTTGPKLNTSYNKLINAYNPPVLDGFNNKFSYIAPLHIHSFSPITNDILPDIFAIFKLPNYEFSNQYSDMNLPEFYEKLKYSECVYSTKIKDGNIGKFFNNFKDSISRSLIEKDFASSVGGGWIYGIDPFEGHFSKKYLLSDDVKNDTLNITKVRSYYKNKLISGNLFNFEFVFDDINNINDDCSVYYGVYLNLEDLYNLNIDINKHNESLKYKVIYDNYEDVVDNSYNIHDDTGVKIYIDDSGDLLNSFIYETIFVDYIEGPTGPYNPTGPTGHIGVTGPLNSTGPGGLIFPIYATGPQQLTVISDKLGLLHQIIDIKDDFINNKHKELTLSSTNINFANFIGTQIKNGYNINGNILTNEGFNNLKITLQRTRTKSTLFENGDYFSIKPSDINKSEWRVIANDNVCCSSITSYHNKGRHIKFNSEYFTVERHNNTRLLNINCGKRVNLYEGDTISVSTLNFTNKKYKIEKIKYDNLAQEHIITIVDNNLLFTNWKNWNMITIEYVEESYDYSYFNPNGSIKTVLTNIAESFKLFENIFVYVTAINNNSIIFRSKFEKDSFSDYKFKYNFSNSNTPTNHLLINDIEAIGTKILDSNDKLIFTRKRGECVLYGYTNKYNNKSRFYIRNEDKLILNGKELVQTKNGKISFQKNIIDGQLIYHSNYIDDFIIKDKEITYTNIDKYITYQINDKNDDIYVNNNGMISISYKYKPEIMKLNILDTELL